MLNVTDATKEAYTADSTHKDFVISFPFLNVTLTNENIISESVELTESIETEEQLTFQGCIAAQLKFKAADVVRDFRGQYVEVTVQSEETEIIPYFKGYVDSQDNMTHQDVVTEFVCYDKLYQVYDKECGAWYDALPLPMTVKAFRDRFFQFIGITQAVNTLPNDALTMERLVSAGSQMKADYIMKCICQANARYGQLGRDGLFYYRKLENVDESFGTYPSQDTYPSNETYPAKPLEVQTFPMGSYSNIDYNPYTTAKITKVIVRDEADVMQGEAGTGTNVFKVSGNMVAFSVDLNRCAQNIYNEVKDLQLTSVRLTTPGLPYIECGDVFLVVTKKNVLNSYVLSRTLSGIQGMKDNYTSDLNEFQRDTDNLANQILKLNGKTNILTRTVDETRSELTAYETATDGTLTIMQSSITQNAREITLKVSKDQLCSEISQSSDRIDIRADRIKISSSYFTLDYNGKIKATDGEFSGKITASSGEIGGFTIGSRALYNGTSSYSSTAEGIYLGTDGINLGGSFKVSRSGALAASSGKIGGFTITTNSLYSGSKSSFNSTAEGVYIGLSGLSVGGIYGFSVSNSGVVTIKPGSSSPFKIGTYFSVSSDGSKLTIGSSARSTEFTDSKITVPSTWTLGTSSVTLMKYNAGTLTIFGSSTKFAVEAGSSNIIFGRGFTGVNIGGSRLKFFQSSNIDPGISAVQQTVNKLATSATLANVVTKVNDLLTALAKYNLIKSS